MSGVAKPQDLVHTLRSYYTYIATCSRSGMVDYMN